MVGQLLLSAQSDDPVVELVSSAPGLTYAEAARRLGGRRTSTLARLRAAVTAGRVHEGPSLVTARGGAPRGATGLFPTAAAAPPAQAGAALPLRDLRTSAGVSQAAVARQLGVSRSLVSNWEAGLQPVPAWAAMRIPAAVEDAQTRRVPIRRRDAGRLRQLLSEVAAEPGITRRRLTHRRPRDLRLLELARRAGQVHEAVVRTGDGFPATGVFPGSAPRLTPPFAPPTGEQLRAARQAAGVTLGPVARRLGITTGSLSKWERDGGELPAWIAGPAATVFQQVAQQAAQRVTELDKQVLDSVCRRPGMTREELLRGTLGRAAEVGEALQRALDAGRIHERDTPTADRTGLIRYLSGGLHLGPAPAAVKLTGAELEQLRRTAGLSCAELARRAGVKKPMVPRWERAEQVPAGRAAQLRELLAAVPTSAQPYAAPVRLTDAQLEQAALAVVAHRPGQPRRTVAAELHGAMQRRLEVLQRLVDDGRLHETPTVKRYADGRQFTVAGLYTRAAGVMRR